MYTELGHKEIMVATEANVERAKEVQTDEAKGERRSCARLRRTVVCPKGKCKLRECGFGKDYGLSGSTNVEINFDDIVQVNEFANESSYMFVGKEIRKYRLGIPMGDPLSCAKANGTCLHAEMTCDKAREERRGDAQRNLTLCYMDDLFMKVAYEVGDGDEEWTEKEADEYLEELKQCYPARLVLE